MLSLRHDAHTQPEQWPKSDFIESDPADDKTVFVCTVEIEQIAGITISPDRPVIALCDVGSSTNWISSTFAQELTRPGPTKINNTTQSSRWKRSKSSRIHIRWNCARLGQHHEEGIFYTVPNAQFKVSFGCAYDSERQLSKRYQASLYTRRKGKRLEQEVNISNKALETFQQGIEQGVLVPLERMPQLPGDRVSPMTIADLEAELDHTYESYSFTEQALTPEVSDQDSFSDLPLSYGTTLSSKDLASLRESEIDNETSYVASSATTSFSEILSHSLQKERADTSQIYSLEGWTTQSFYEEPQPWVPRLYNSKTRPLSFKRCRELTSRQKSKIAAIRTTAEKEAMEYWQWDEERQNYKHYDEGCSEPVWYNPP